MIVWVLIETLIILILFGSLIYYKLMLHKIRVKLQSEHIIPKETNLLLITTMSIIFWFCPATKFIKKGELEHDKIAKKINYILVAFLLVIILALIIPVYW